MPDVIGTLFHKDIPYGGVKGDKGDTGATPNVSATASVDSTTGTPSVNVVKTGTAENPSFAFDFHNLKGEKGDPGSGTSVSWGEIDGDIEDQTDLKDELGKKIESHVGMVIHSTTLDTEAKVKAVYGGTTWVQLSGYMLRGASSGVIPNQNLNDGGADSVTVSSVASHNHTQNAHTHTQNAHTHTQNAHDHTLVDPSNSTYSPSGARLRYDLGGGASGNLVYTHGTAAGKKINSTTATNQNQTATNQNQTATNKANGANYTVNTLPKYKNVYIWERTA